ncbi:Cleavage induced protein [Phytophthora megakarya]|uniref:Cleavage induced protein n=1 Tax=Phytophthora megakarya TaxID=4795 RepID=A0A225WC72_9STRA|nr:Cleavage induced protein [Phytophthora megakarya]
MCSLRQGFNHHHHTVEATRCCRKASNEVHRNVTSALMRNGMAVQLTRWFLISSLRLSTDVTPLHWYLELRSRSLLSFQPRGGVDSRDALLEWLKLRKEYEESTKERCKDGKEEFNAVLKSVRSAIDDDLLTTLSERAGFHAIADNYRNHVLPPLNELFLCELKMNMENMNIQFRKYFSSFFDGEKGIKIKCKLLVNSLPDSLKEKDRALKRVKGQNSKPGEQRPRGFNKQKRQNKDQQERQPDKRHKRLRRGKLISFRVKQRSRTRNLSQRMGVFTVVVSNCNLRRPRLSSYQAGGKREQALAARHRYSTKVSRMPADGDSISRVVRRIFRDKFR